MENKEPSEITVDENNTSTNIAQEETTPASTILNDEINTKKPEEKQPEEIILSPEDIAREQKNKLFEWTKLYAGFILFFNIVLLALTIFTLAYTQKRIISLKNQTIELRKTIEPLRDFYNQKDKLVNKALYERQQQQILNLQKEKVELLNNLKNSKQMIVNLSRSLQVAESINSELEDEKSDTAVENKNLSRDLKFEKMKSNIKPKTAENNAETN